jgi:hypothetical protein
VDGVIIIQLLGDVINLFGVGFFVEGYEIDDFSAQMFYFEILKGFEKSFDKKIKRNANNALL